MVALSVALVLLVERSRLGRLLRAMADSPTALATAGLSVNFARVLVFCISAFLAGISGAVFSSQFGSVNGDSFPYLQSLVLMSVLAISGRANVAGALIGVVLLFIVPGYIDDPDALTMLQIGFGAAALLAALASTGAFSSWLAASAAGAADRLSGPARDRLDPTDIRDRGVPVAGPRHHRDPRSRTRSRRLFRVPPTQDVGVAPSLFRRLHGGPIALTASILVLAGCGSAYTTDELLEAQGAAAPTAIAGGPIASGRASFPTPEPARRRERSSRVPRCPAWTRTCGTVLRWSRRRQQARSAREQRDGGHERHGAATGAATGGAGAAATARSPAPP